MIEIVKASPVVTECEQQVLQMPNLDGTRTINVSLVSMYAICRPTPCGKFSLSIV